MCKKLCVFRADGTFSESTEDRDTVDLERSVALRPSLSASPGQVTSVSRSHCRQELSGYSLLNSSILERNKSLMFTCSPSLDHSVTHRYIVQESPITASLSRRLTHAELWIKRGWALCDCQPPDLRMDVDLSKRELVGFLKVGSTTPLLATLRSAGTAPGPRFLPCYNPAARGDSLRASMLVFMSRLSLVESPVDQAGLVLDGGQTEPGQWTQSPEPIKVDLRWDYSHSNTG
ncbi:hypothetical protein RRG08_020708 [Elysia crispata]|uniref:Uncharacterized protein n=1 Tax=Elysia crispata TaxID=231223 RepID=A0AAE1B0G5_9GAST|nr:hypothetical protein RRG08_020708 [Elysia crispata]